MISDRLKKIILKELSLEDFDLQDSTQAFQVPGWDSLSHAALLVAIEKEYQIRFQLTEILRLKNLGDLQLLLTRKTSPENSP